MPVGRTRVATTSRSRAPISIPTPEPNARSLRKSLESSNAMGGSVAPRRVVPAQDMNRAIVTLRHVLHLLRDRAFGIGKLPVGEADPRGGADGEDGVAFAPQSRRAWAKGGTERGESRVRERGCLARMQDEPHAFGR